MSIHLDLTENEAALIETIINEAKIEMEEDLFWADEFQDWEEYDAIMEEYAFFDDIISTIQVQMIDEEVNA